MKKYAYPEGCREIFGFGDYRERICRAMVIAGSEWLDAYPRKDPKVYEFSEVFGCTLAINDDGEELASAMLKVTTATECSGDMLRTAMRHVYQVKRHGWAGYIDGLTSKSDVVQRSES